MEWLWSDLKVGDKVKISDAVFKNYKRTAWAYSYGDRMLVVVETKILWEPDVSIYVVPIGSSVKGHFCIDPQTGIERTANLGGQFFDIVELAKD